MTKPYLSVVVVARNDNYGGGFLAKLQTFQRVLVELCTEAQLQTEIVLVEWNPPPENPGIAEVVRSSVIGSEEVKLRIITVPASVHSGLPLSSQQPVLEYLGKNAGIRRASGEFILATNPDTLFSAQLVDRLKSRRLREDTFYRVDRADVASPAPQDAPARKIEAYCRQNVLRTHGRWFEAGPKNRSIRHWLLQGPAIARRALGDFVRYRTCVPLHFGAPGDFILMHQRQWHKIRGFPELEMFAGRGHHLDGLTLVAASYQGLRQEVFGGSCVLYHQEHERPEQEKAWAPPVQFVYDAMRALHRPWYNSAEWGLGEHTLPEQIV